MHKRTYEQQINVVYSKIIEAINLTKGNIAVSFSGGKDSGMLLYMVAKIWSDIYKDKKELTVIFANTSNELLSMHSFIKRYVDFIETNFNIMINLKTASAKKAYKNVVFEVGFPFVSKKVARMVSDVRKELKRLKLTYEDIKEYLHNGKKDTIESLIKKAENLRKLGFSNTTVCNMTRIKSDNKTGTCFVAQQWQPLFFAPFEISHNCCKILKKAPIKAVEKELGKLQPMIGEMADNSKTRMDSYRKTGCNLFDSNGVGISKPLGAVTEETVKKFYFYEKIPLAPAYGEILFENESFFFSGEQNTGCKLCGFGIMYDWDRFIRLQKIEPDTIRIAFTPIDEGGLGYKQICEFLNKYCKCKIQIPIINT